MFKITERQEMHDAALRALFLETRMTTFPENAADFQEADFDKETEGEYILVAFDKSVIAGFVSVWLADNFIHHLYVMSKYQQQGIGTKLLHAVIEKIGLPVSLKCELKNEKAMNFYKKKGFAEKEKGESETGTYVLLELGEN